MKSKIWFVLAMVWCSACRSAAAADQPATLTFVLVAPLCSSVLPVEFFVDARSVGIDTFRVAVNAPRTVSHAFTIDPGSHELSAHVVGGYVWPSHTVSILAGSAYADSLALYCS